MFSVCIVFYLFFLVEDWHTQRWLMVKAVGWRFARSNPLSIYYRYLVFNPLCLSLFGEINSCSTLLFFSFVYLHHCVRRQLLCNAIFQFFIWFNRRNVLFLLSPRAGSAMYTLLYMMCIYNIFLISEKIF